MLHSCNIAKERMKVMKNFESIKELIKCYKKEGLDISQMKKVALYMRYSSKNQTEDSIEYQRRKILEFCYKNALLPVEEYIDEAYSGRNDKRPEFRRMMRDSENNPKWEEIMLFNLSRFCRNAWLGIKCFKDLRARGLEITSVVENFPKTPEGRFMESFYHIFNEYSSEINATHTREGLMNRALKGLHCGGTAPLGYDVDKETKRYIINPTEAEIVKLIFSLYENNLSYQAIAEELNKEGYKTKRGTSFNKNSFDSILKQAKYTGKYVWNKSYAKTATGKRNNRGQKDEQEKVELENVFPIIIPNEQFERVQEMMKNSDKKKKQNYNRKHYMLGGLAVLKCKKCGSNLQAETVYSHGKKYEVYFCPKHKKKECSLKPIKADSLHAWAANLIVKDLKERKDIKTIFALLNGDNGVLNILQNRLDGKNTAIQNLTKLYESNPDEKLRVKLDGYIHEKEVIQNRIKKANEVAKAYKVGNLSDICKQFKELLIYSNDVDVRAYIKSIIETIEVDEKETELNLKIE